MSMRDRQPHEDHHSNDRDASRRYVQMTDEVHLEETDASGSSVKVYDGILIHERHRLGWLWYLQISLEVYSDLQSIFFWLCLDVFGEPL